MAVRIKVDDVEYEVRRVAPDSIVNEVRFQAVRAGEHEPVLDWWLGHDNTGAETLNFHPFREAQLEELRPIYREWRRLVGDGWKPTP